MKIRRRKTRRVKIGNIEIGAGAAISIQSMTKTNTRDIHETIREIKTLQKNGCEIVRVAIKGAEDITAFGKIKNGVKAPLVADIHFNYKLALGAIEKGADAIRLNPGNIYRQKELKEVIREAKISHTPVRIGVNSGSLRIRQKKRSEDEQMVETALHYTKYFEDADFHDIIISLKSSDVLSTIAAYRKMARLCDYPFHLGITAAGPYDIGIIKSCIGVGSLLLEGVGDTIRVSLTADPIEEVIAAKRILQALRLRNFGPDIISCPTCGRCRVDLEDIVKKLRDTLYANHKPLSTKHPITIAVMGCEVNGPGEAREAYIGIAAGKGSGVLFKRGKIIKKVKEKDFVKEIQNHL